MSSQPEDRESSAQPTQSTGKPLTPNQEAARLRRERRNAKIQGGGSARLEAISRLNGRKGGGNDEGKEKEGCGVGAGMGVEFGTGMDILAFISNTISRNICRFWGGCEEASG